MYAVFVCIYNRKRNLFYGDQLFDEGAFQLVVLEQYEDLGLYWWACDYKSSRVPDCVTLAQVYYILAYQQVTVTGIYTAAAGMQLLTSDI